VLIFGKASKNRHNFVFNNNNIEIGESYKYLGVLFNTIHDIRGNMFRSMPCYVSDKARKASFAAMNKCKGMGKISPKIGLKMFDTFVLPVIEYGSEIWSCGREIIEIERVQLKFLKMLLGVKQSTASCAILAETGRYPLYIRSRLKVLKFYFRIVLLNNYSVVKNVFLQLQMLDRLGFVKNNWVSSVKNIFIKLDLVHYYEMINPPKGVVDKCMEEARTKLNDDYSKLCLEDISNMPVLRTYCKFKTEFKMENYLITIRSFKLRSFVSKLRLSSHNLAIEKGRHVKPKIPIECRICTMCPLGAVEDESHLLLLCPFYKNERSWFLNMHSGNKPFFCIVFYLFSDLSVLGYFVLGQKCSVYLYCTQVFITDRCGKLITVFPLLRGLYLAKVLGIDLAKVLGINLEKVLGINLEKVLGFDLANVLGIDLFWLTSIRYQWYNWT
jgi:hypothetical protein